MSVASSDIAVAALADAQEIPDRLSAGQVACLLAYAASLGLLTYAEVTAYFRGRHEKAEEQDVEEAPQQPPHLSPSNAAPLQTSQSAYINDSAAEDSPLKGQINHAAHQRRSELGTILLWYYIADRTKTLAHHGKSYSRDVLGFLVLALAIVAGWTSVKPCRTPALLNRQQTEEWKGWMQVLFLLYHYFDAREVYNAIRVFIAGYVWMTGFGNFSYYYKTGDFGVGRFCAMMWRLNFLVVLVCLALRNSYMLYYICPMHTLFTILVYAVLGVGARHNSSSAVICAKLAGCVVLVYICWDVKPVFYALWWPFQAIMSYSDPRRPTDDPLHEWYFRSSLDRYVWIHGMLCAFLHPAAERGMQRIDQLERRLRWLVRAGLLAGVAAGFWWWYAAIYCLPKLQYNRVHPYTSWIPLTLWVVARNLTPGLRGHSLALFGWLGCVTLETYISQFHTWLATSVPDGQPKLLLGWLPAEYPLLNFAGTTAVYVFLSHRLFVLTNSLRTVVFPTSKGNADLARNLALLLISAAALYVISWLLVSVLPVIA